VIVKKAAVRVFGLGNTKSWVRTPVIIIYDDEINFLYLDNITIDNDHYLL